jgi:UDP-N-acetylmuramoyl-tripeptide--D-alanyl-D-alanine ligase
MGMNRRGEMELLASIARPDVAVITNIGSAHSGMLGSVEAVAEEKRSILSFSDNNSIALIKFDEPYLDFLVKDFKGTLKLFGEWGKNGWESFSDLGTGGFVIYRKGRKINFRIPGMHNLYNAMAASEAALALGAGEDSVVKGLEASVPVSGRTEIKNGEIVVIRDYYNANPESLLAALRFYEQLETDGRKLFVMGDLLELGKTKPDALREIGEKLAEGSINTVFLFGENLSPVKEAAEKQAVHPDFFVFRSIEEIKTALKDYLKKGDSVLLKGSRGSALERLDNVLEQIGSG